LCYALLFIVIGVSTKSQAAESNCSNRNVGEIRLSNGRKIPEVSGIARRAPGDVYLVSDDTRWLYHARLSGDRWSVDRYAISSEGFGPNNEGIYDIEDVAYGPCPEISEGQCIFIGEIGGNPSGKNVFEIHYIREQDLTGQRGRYVKTTRIRYRYPGGWNFDAEGLAVHPRTGELFVVTKTRGSPSYIYKMDPRFPERPPTKVIEIDLAALFGDNTNARQITGLEISPDGSRFAVVTYEALMEFSLDLAEVKNYRRLPGDTWNKRHNLLGDWWGTGTNIRSVQVESITYDGSNSHFLIIGEGNAAVQALDCSEPSGQESQVSPSMLYSIWKNPYGPGVKCLTQTEAQAYRDSGHGVEDLNKPCYK
jgi:hypothetical protein